MEVAFSAEAIYGHVGIRPGPENPPRVPGAFWLSLLRRRRRGDRYADFLRAFSILVVVFGHWLIAVVTWQDGKVDGANALEVIDGIWVVTWVLQVMPLFFFVGGFSNLRSWESAQARGDGYASFLYTRMLRMMRPTAVFLGISLVVITVLDAMNVGDNAVFPASELIAPASVVPRRVHDRRGLGATHGPITSALRGKRRGCHGRYSGGR